MDTGLLKEVITTLGGDANNLPDNLLTTHLKALCEALGVDTSDMEDNLTSSYLRKIINEYRGGGLGGNTQHNFVAGLYQTGAIDLYNEQGADAIEGMMIKSWDELLADGTVGVENGVVYTPFDPNEWVNPSSDALAGDLLLPNDGSITKVGNAYWDNDVWNDSWEEYGDYVGYFGFPCCENLTSVLMPNSVTSLCENAFDSCAALTNIILPSNLVSIGAGAFKTCESLISIDIPNGVTSIALSTFGYCTALTQVTLPSNLVSIGEMAFVCCINLTSIDIPSNVTSIGVEAFLDCPALKDVTLSSNLVSIETMAFASCANLTSIDIPSSVTSIGAGAFIQCPSLTSLMFKGTIAQWNAISKGIDWNREVPATKVVCSDGEVSLK